MIYLLQGGPAEPQAVVAELGFWWWLLITVTAVIVLVLGFVVGNLWTRLRHYRERRDREARMFNVEKALSQFFEHDKAALVEERDRLARQVAELEGRVEDYRRRAAGLGNKPSQDARSELLLNTLIENEALQERLFQEHVRQKDERDRHLDVELKSLSYQRVLLSRLLEEKGVRQAIDAVLADDGKLAELQEASGRIEHLGSGQGSGSAGESGS